MWWVVLLLVLAGCAQEVAEVAEPRGVWIESLESLPDAETAFLLTVCSDDALYRGAFVPFAVAVGERSARFEKAPFERSDACVSVRFEIERAFQEELLARRSMTITLDPVAGESSTIVYEPERVCIDSDGDNPFLSGFVTARIEGETLFVLDSCANATASEYVCDGSGRIELLLYGCRDECTGGSCRCRNSETCLTDGSATLIIETDDL